MKVATQPHVLLPGWESLIEYATILKTTEVATFFEDPSPDTMLIIPFEKAVASIIYENANPQEPFSVFSSQSSGGQYSKKRCLTHVQEMLPRCTDARCLRVEGTPDALHNLASGLHWAGEKRFPMPGLMAEAVREKLIIRASSTPLDFD